VADLKWFVPAGQNRKKEKMSFLNAASSCGRESNWVRLVSRHSREWEQLAMRVLITGSRTWGNVHAIRRELEKLSSGSIIIHGGARGADTIADSIARELDLEVLVFRAEWARFYRAAGVIRNEAMLKEGKPDLVLAFHEEIATSKGTHDMVRRATAAGVPVRVISK
jgi:hypothetical protein